MLMPIRSTLRSASAAGLAASVIVLAVAGGETWLAPARAAGDPRDEAGASAPDTRKADPDAIRAVMQSFVRAYTSRDPKAFAAHWTTEGEYRDEAGETVRGREAIEKGFAAILAAAPELTAEVRLGTLRFLGADAAVEDGTAIVRRGPAAPATRARYDVLLVREQGRWLIAQLSESPEDRAMIEDLAWLIGDWRSIDGQGAEIRVTYSWAPNKKFIRSQFSIKEAKLELGGSQVIGVDPATGLLHSWTFEADGGVGEADWDPDGEHWVLDAVGTLADGRTLTEANILRRVDDNTFTWQSIDRRLDEAQLPDLAPVKVTRLDPAK
jgi:uncharacterized protein (TIGR02246 family)